MCKKFDNEISLNATTGSYAEICGREWEFFVPADCGIGQLSVVFRDMLSWEIFLKITFKQYIILETFKESYRNLT